MRLFDIEKEKLCPLVEPGSICGVTCAEFSKITGCREGIPVVTAGGDQQCGAVGQGVVKKGISSITAGTGGYLEAASEGVPDHSAAGHCVQRFLGEGAVYPGGQVLTCCSAFDWFRKEFCGRSRLRKNQ